MADDSDNTPQLLLHLPPILGIRGIYPNTREKKGRREGYVVMMRKEGKTKTPLHIG